MKAVGYQTVDVQPWETASGGKAVVCHGPAACTLTTTLDKPAGKYDIAVQYFDIWHGVSHYDLLVNGKSVAAWAADDTLPPAQPDPNLDGQDSTRFTVHDISLKPGDTLELSGLPDIRPELDTTAVASPHPGGRTLPPMDLREFAPVDYIEVGPNGPITPQ